MVSLSDLIPSTNYSVVVMAINTARFRNSSDPVIGTTLTGKLQSPEAETSSALSTFHFSLQPSHPSTLQPTPPSSQFLYPHTVLVLLSCTSKHIHIQHYHSTSPSPAPPHSLTPHSKSSPHHLTPLPLISSLPHLHILTSSPPHLLLPPAPPPPLEPLPVANQTGGPRTYTLILPLVSSVNGPIR